MGAVYKATDPQLDRFVAIKVLTHREPKYVERFRREAQVLAKIMHPSIIQIYEIVGSDEEQLDPYIVMEYFEGKPLDTMLKMGPLPGKTMVNILRQTAEGLKKAHSNAVIHRDIKPANIMMAANGDVKILDFGIAKALDAKKDLTGNTVLGTPYYMSPEQAMGQPIDARTDIYSLGITAFHLLTGKRPFEAKSKVDVMLMQVKNPLPSIHDSVQGVDDRLVKIVERMCAKQPQSRYQNTDELVAALDELPKSLGGRVPDGSGDSQPSVSAKRAPQPPPPPPSTSQERPVKASTPNVPPVRAEAPRPGTPRPASSPAAAPVRAQPPQAQTPGRTPRQPTMPPVTPARAAQAMGVSGTPVPRPDVFRGPPAAVPKPSRAWVGIVIGAVAGLVIAGGALVWFLKAKDANKPGRVPAKGWIYPGAPAPPLKKVQANGGYGNCVFSTKPIEAGKEEAAQMRTIFGTNEGIHGRCYFAHQVGPNKAGEVWQELWVDGVKRAQIIYDPPLPNDDDQLQLEPGVQHASRINELPSGKHVFSLWIYRQGEDAENPEPLAAGEFTVRK
ncbi:MAG: protein kinase [Deltaproteobacteria bacterium]|nr:protein kinase [Deltaproteobacteria bacterium]